MSRSNMLVIQLHSKTPSPIVQENIMPLNPKTVIRLLMDIGWSIATDEGTVVYLPLNDNGAFDWKYEHITEDNFWEIIDIKSKNNELIGIQMYWKSNVPGLDLLISYSKDDYGSYLDMNIGMDLYRKDLMPEIWLPDYNWYAQHILPCLWKEYHISQYSFNFTF